MPAPIEQRDIRGVTNALFLAAALALLVFGGVTLAPSHGDSSLRTPAPGPIDFETGTNGGAPESPSPGPTDASLRSDTNRDERARPMFHWGN